MRTYKQLTLEQRYILQAYVNDNKSQKEIAALIGVSKSTVCRELERHSAGGKYKAVKLNAGAIIKTDDVHLIN